MEINFRNRYWKDLQLKDKKFRKSVIVTPACNYRTTEMEVGI